jgi:hypothetical protein
MDQTVASFQATVRGKENWGGEERREASKGRAKDNYNRANLLLFPDVTFSRQTNVILQHARRLPQVADSVFCANIANDPIKKSTRRLPYNS